jgi:hypothetical protein
MHTVEISNGQHTPVRGLTEILYAAYQLHVWLKRVKIAKVYLVQQATLTGDCTLYRERDNDFISITIKGKKICAGRANFMPERLYSSPTSW